MKFKKANFFRRLESNVQVKRANNLIRTVERAANEGLPIRLIVFERKNRRVQFRALDEVPWAVISYNSESGDFLLRRGAVPVKLGEVDDESRAFGLEGEKRRLFVIHRKREARARAAKIADALHRNNGRLPCEVPGCGFDFVEQYGEIGEGFAHVHHKLQLSDAPDEGREVSLEELAEELAVVCPNCHAMIHIGGECRPVETLKCATPPARPAGSRRGSRRNPPAKGRPRARLDRLPPAPSRPRARV